MKRIAIGLLLALAFFVVPPASGDEVATGAAASPASLCPADAFLYIETAPLADVRRDLDAFGMAACPQFYPMLSVQIEQFMATPLATSIDLTRSAAFAMRLAPVAPGEDPFSKEPVPLLIVPVRDALAFREAFQKMDPGSVIVERGGYALVSSDAAHLAYEAGPAPAFATTGDVRMVLDVARLRAVGGANLEAKIVEGRDQALLMMSLGISDPAQAAVQRAMLGWYFDMILKAVQQAGRVEGAADLSAERVRATWRVSPEALSGMETFFRAQPSGLGTLHRMLPPDAWLTMAMRYDRASWMEGFEGMIAAMTSSGGGAASSGAIDAFRGVVSMYGDEVAAAYVPGGLCMEGYMGGAPTPATRGALETWFSALRPTVPNAPSISRWYEHAGFPVAEITIPLVPPGAPPEAAEAVRRMFGGADMRMALHLGAPVQTMVMGDEARLRAAVGRIAAAGAPTAPAWHTQMVAQVPGHACSMFAIDLIRAIVFGGDIQARTMGLPTNPFASVGTLGQAPIAFYAGFPEGTMEFGCHIPASSVATMSSAVPMLMMLGAQMQQGPPPPPQTQPQGW
ncbi:MAG: hypothetical protein HY608_10655 [Planctomycetes bacterium]|nr:hypothetical protein [Planctomycetota bacterium]